MNLYAGHAALLCEGSSPMLNSRREDAYRRLQAMSLPKEGSDNYENCDLEAMLAPDYGLNLARIPIDVNPQATFRCDVPMVSRSLFMLVNDSFSETPESRVNLPEGVEVGSLRNIPPEMQRRIASYYGKIADMENPVVALNTLLVQDGIYIYVGKGVRVEHPIQIVNILENGTPLMALRRLIVVAEENSSVKIIACDHTQNPEADFLSLETIEVFVGRNSDVDYYSLEESTERTNRISALYSVQEAGSRLSVDGLTLFNGTTRNEYYCRLEGEDAELSLCGMGIEDNSRKVSTYSHISHLVPRCKSEELFKYTLDDEARGAFTGRIHVAPGAVKTEAYQSNRNLVGSVRAKMTSRPELEIYNDDVKCSHGTAIGQLDAGQLFYMRTRGLDEEQARMLLKQAFMADVIDKVRVGSLRDRLRMLVERRFSGETSACKTCAHGCNK